ncbi:protein STRICTOSIDINE SYNTHASE-LIKE 2-like [Impatiens glandulifera]|uniref:protein STRICTOSIDINE SYNTHASE-LIKE 2-like n=1 Tax=Impatiens glandulifera TaxID=253017 RepID=UPI001FB052FE|nr:protein STRICTOSIDINE SYNTHASE-LIKE 2-like [Impatiens glandulifera]
MKMKSKFIILVSAIVVLLLSIINFRDLSPDSFYDDADADAGDQKLFAGTAQKEIFPIDGAVGPESLAFDPNGGGPYAGVSDGRIIKWIPDQRRWIDFALTSSQREGCLGQHNHVEREHICGRPLGLRFNKRTGDLYVADAYMGLLVVGPNGGLGSVIATEAQGIPFKCTNAIDIDQTTGEVYFTDSSSIYPRRNYLSTILGNDYTGRLMKYNPATNQVSVLLTNLSFANGVALHEKNDFVLVAESNTRRIHRLWLQTNKVGQSDIFAELPGFPDNIRRRENKGGYWVGIHGKRTKVSDWVQSNPWFGKLVLGLNIDMTRAYSRSSERRSVGLALRLGENGEVVEVWEDKEKNGFKFVSEVDEIDGVLWIGSLISGFVGKQRREI